MKRFFVSFALLICISGFILDNEKSRVVEHCYATGEEAEYRVHYGLINAGEAKIEVHPKLYLVNDRVCYKATVFGKSTGAFDFMLRIRNTWGSYIDTSNMLPQKGFRNIEEGKYRLKENTYFDYKQAEVNIDRETRDSKNKQSCKIPLDVQDIVSGYFYLRSVDYTRCNVGDTIGVNAFFEDKLYDFRVKYMGKCVVDTKFGNVKALKIVPIMPENSFFKGKNAISMWLSDDKNKLPIKIEAELVVGSVDMDIKSYKGLKHPLNFCKK